MGFTFGTLIYVMVLLVNAMAVLSEDRFIARIGWSVAQPAANTQQFQQTYDQTGYGGPPPQADDVKSKAINLISAVRTVMRIPLIGINIVIIAYELVLGK